MGLGLGLCPEMASRITAGEVDADHHLGGLAGNLLASSSLLEGAGMGESLWKLLYPSTSDLLSGMIVDSPIFCRSTSFRTTLHTTRLISEAEVATARALLLLLMASVLSRINFPRWQSKMYVIIFVHRICVINYNCHHSSSTLTASRTTRGAAPMGLLGRRRQADRSLATLAAGEVPPVTDRTTFPTVCARIRNRYRQGLSVCLMQMSSRSLPALLLPCAAQHCMVPTAMVG